MKAFHFEQWDKPREQYEVALLCEEIIREASSVSTSGTFGPIQNLAPQSTLQLEYNQLRSNFE